MYGGVFHLKTVEHVIQRGREMLGRARGIVLCDLSPGPCERLADALRETAASGVLVICHVYAGEEIEGVHTLQLIDHDPALDDWPGQQISLVVDSEEHLLGLLAMDMKSVHEAVWSSSNFLSCMHHNNVAAELMAIGPLSRHAGPAVDVAGLLNRITLMKFRPSGLETLIRRFGPEPAKGRKNQR
jgi:hypothetical protein